MSLFDALRDAAWDDFSVTFKEERAFALEVVWCAPPLHAASDARWSSILSCGLEDATDDGKLQKLNPWQLNLRNLKQRLQKHRRIEPQCS